MFQLAAIVASMKESGAVPSEVRASGGFARSELWCQMLADMLGVPVTVPESVESSALGAAQLGLYALEGCRGPLLRWTETGGRQYEPDREVHSRYAAMLPLYLSLYTQSKAAMHELSKLQAGWR